MKLNSPKRETENHFFKTENHWPYHLPLKATFPVSQGWLLIAGSPVNPIF